MLDSDPAELYEVETKTLNRAAKRNEGRFPEDFRFKLTREELDNLRCQIGTLAGQDTDSSIGRTYLLHVYTEQGVAMLSGVLRSKVEINHHCALALAVDFPEECSHVVALRIEHPDDERPPVVAFKKDHPASAGHAAVPRVDAAERAQRRPGSRDVGEQLRLLYYGIDKAPRCHGARELALDQLRGMAAKAVEAARLLSDAGPDVIDFIPTAPCFILSVEGEGQLIDRIAQATGIQATGGARSCADALKWLGATKILSYTPYAEPLQKMSDEYFADSGLTVVGRKNLRFEDPANINRVSPYEIVRDIVTLAHEHPEADGVFCCGGCFRTVGVVAEIERECGIPVVGTQQANMWNCLRMCGVNDRLEGFGTLLERPRL